jgi:hypothetical protein
MAVEVEVHLARELHRLGLLVRSVTLFLVPLVEQVLPVVDLVAKVVVSLTLV